MSPGTRTGNRQVKYVFTLSAELSRVFKTDTDGLPSRVHCSFCIRKALLGHNLPLSPSTEPMAAQALIGRGGGDGLRSLAGVEKGTGINWFSRGIPPNLGADCNSVIPWEPSSLPPPPDPRGEHLTLLKNHLSTSDQGRSFPSTMNSHHPSRS